MLNREKALEELREEYRKKDFKALKRKYYMLSHFLTDEDKKKILPILNPVIKKALDTFNGTIV